jgi:hypothetical protein
LESDDAASVGLVFTSKDENFQAFYSFGTPVMNQEIYDAREAKLNSLRNTKDEEALSNVNARAASSYTYSTMALGNFIQNSNNPVSISGTGAALRIFKSPTYGRIMYTLESKCSSFKQDKFNSGTFLGAYVEAYRLELQRIGQSGYIDGVERYAVDVGKNYKKLSTAFSTAGAILAELPSPYSGYASTIITLLKAVTSTPIIDYQHKTDDIVLHVSQVGDGHLQLDKAPFPLVFQLEKNGVTFQGTAYSDLTYLIEMDWSAFYVRTTQIKTTVSMYY